MAARFAFFAFFLCLLCLSPLSTAREPVDLPAIDSTNHDSLPDAANTIFLPSERSESESATVTQSQPEIHDSKIPEPDTEVATLKSTEASEASDPAPIVVVNFRPLNRHMPWRPMQFSSRPGHRCRHNHKFKPWNPRLPRHPIPYGNDMILSNADDKSSDMLSDDQVNQIPIRWTKFGRVEPSFNDETGIERSEVMMRPHHHHHHHEHEHDHHDDHDHDHEHDHHDDHEHEHDHDQFHERFHEDGGLMKRIRKFLQHF